MTIPTMATVAKIKGIDLLATGDFTHPIWMKELESQLEEVAEGIYAEKESTVKTHFVFGTEISCIYTQGGKGRRVHTLVLVPSIEVAQTVNAKLSQRGCNLSSDGRPIIGLSLIELCALLFSIDENILVIPAHIWTPWFGVLGSSSGFDSLRESCGIYADKIYALETGLSSDPAMNWKVSELDRYSLVSFSDAHSPEKLGRELTVFASKKNVFTLSYKNLSLALQRKGEWQIDYTIEFYPEEGKYHIDGHRLCGVCQTPEKTRKKGRQCHVCGKTLTLGVEGRVDQLANGKEVELGKETNQEGVVFYKNAAHPPYVKLVPLQEVIAESIGKGVKTKAVATLYDTLIANFGSELAVLMKAKQEDLHKLNGKVAEAVLRVRSGNIFVQPGFDGVFGVVKIWGSEGRSEEKSKEQMSLFD